MRHYILLIEAMRLAVRLLESRIDFLRQTFLTRIEQMITGMTIPPSIAAGIARQDGASEAERLFNFVLACDPDPVKKNSQWLLTQILRKNGAMPLEDLEGASETLTQYAEMKKARQIPPDKADINAFKSLSELQAVVGGEAQVQVQKVDAEEAAMLAQSEVLLNNAQLLILIPKTVAAACYFGRTTDWCTAWGDHRSHGLSGQGRYPTRTNQYEYYSRSGPLYIVIEKSDGAHWQLSFETHQFMDATDRPFDVAKLVRRHPQIVQAIGEEKFIPFAKQLGLSFFSPAARAQFPDSSLAALIKTKADLKLVPPEKQAEKNFVREVVRQDPAAIQWFSPAVVDAFGPSIAQMRNMSAVFKYLPPHLQTQELADEVVRTIGWREIENDIPKKLWSPAITAHYWESKSAGSDITLKDIPEAFHQICAVNCLSRHIEDIPHHTKLLNQDNVIKIVNRTIDAIKYIPSNFLNQQVAELLAYNSRKLTSTFAHTGDPRELWQYFDSRYWPEAAVKWMLEHGKLPFNKMPEHLRTTENLALLVNKEPKAAADIPKHYWTRDLLAKVITKYGSVLRFINPDYVPEDLLAGLPKKDDAPETGYRDKFDDFFFSHSLPQSMKTPKVVAAFVAEGYVSLDDIPPDLLSETNVLRRIAHHPEEAEKIPPEMFTKAFAIKLVEANKQSMEAIPERYYTEPLLFAWLSKLNDSRDHHGYYRSGIEAAKQIFQKFLSDMWSSRTVALAIETGLLAPKKSLIPAPLMNKEVAQAIIAKNHEDVTELDPHLDDDSLVQAVKRNWQLLKTIPPEKITEPMAYAAMQAHASHASPHNRAYYRNEDSPLLAPLQAIPKRVWSKRVYAEAVGYVVPLKAVPAKWRDDQMIQQAVIRDPANVKALPDPAKWLNDHLPNYGDATWREKLEAAGVAVIKKKFINVAGLPRETLASGTSYALMQAGPVNLRCYVFDKKGQYAFYFYTDKGEAKLIPSEIVKAQPYATDLLAIARAVLPGFNAGDLNEVGIYGENGRFRVESQSTKTQVGDLTWTRNEHLKGIKVTAWLTLPPKRAKPGNEDQEGKTQYKPAITMQAWSTGAGWGRSNQRIQEVKIFDFAYCLTHSKDIAHYINTKMHMEGGWGPLSRLGIYYTKNSGAETIAERNIGQYGDLAIYRNNTRIGLFGPTGMIASGVIRATGKIDKVKNNWHSDVQVGDAAIEHMFDRISKILMKNKDATGISLSEMLRRIGQRL